MVQRQRQAGTLEVAVAWLERQVSLGGDLQLSPLAAASTRKRHGERSRPAIRRNKAYAFDGSRDVVHAPLEASSRILAVALEKGEQKKAIITHRRPVEVLAGSAAVTLRMTCAPRKARQKLRDASDMAPKRGENCLVAQDGNRGRRDSPLPAAGGRAPGRSRDGGVWELVLDHAQRPCRVYRSPPPRVQRACAAGVSPRQIAVGAEIVGRISRNFGKLYRQRLCREKLA